MKIGIISTGDELLRGAIADTNAAWMAAEFHGHGYDVSRIVTVGDDIKALSSALGEAFDEFELVIVGGGLGPTDDDVTAKAAALAAGCSLVRNDEAATHVRTVFEIIGRPMSEINLKQADLPEGCAVLMNPCGTAPGFALNTAKGRAVFLPGVPIELKTMFEQHVLQVLPAPSSSRFQAVFRCFGMGESDIQTVLKPIAAAFPTVRWSYRPSFPEIGVTISAYEQETFLKVREEVLSALGRTVFAEEEIDLPTALGRVLVKHGYTLATAESCTGGLIGHSITETAGSSEYFRGGIVAYDDRVKESVLGVDKAVLDAHGAVSEVVVRSMAQGVKNKLDVDLGIAVSGIAGPGGGTAEKPVGLVHMAVAHSRGVDHQKRVFKGYERWRVKRISAWSAMWMAIRTTWEN
ncbi:MAG: CinA family nicotinamide mononucleotide deamidase-related protein [Proteobacteria bacterium]|nr:CinA family nicotinamide mononucleotide deamidase-related protein [Pseudomonadota bacterium]